MDLLAHVLWVALGVEAARRRTYVSGLTAEATLLMALGPDLLQLIPALAWIVLGDGTFSMLTTYSMAVSDGAVAMPAPLQMLAQQLHELTHSVVIALAVTFAITGWLGRLWFPLLGWWLHIVIDVFSHAPEYSSPALLYPFTSLRLETIGWSEDAFIALNFVTLVLAAAALYLTRESREPWDDGD